MAITQGVCTSFKTELMRALHDFTASTGHTFKIALYTSSADLGPSTTAYTSVGEVSGDGYSAGGATLTSATPASSGGVAYGDFLDVTWATSSITARGALIYNSTSANRAVMVLDFGSDKTSSAGDFTIVFPAANATDAIIRIGS
jgi:hypothetical protein